MPTAEAVRGDTVAQRLGRPKHASVGAKRTEENLIFVAMDLLGQWPSKIGDVEKAYRTQLRGRAKKMGRYVCTNESPLFLAEAVELLAMWPEETDSVNDPAQIALRSQVVDLYDRWTRQRRILVTKITNEQEMAEAERAARLGQKTPEEAAADSIRARRTL